MSGGRVKDVSDEFMVEDATPSGGPRQLSGAQRETDPHRLAQRQKQLDLGKNTLGYQRYRQAVPRERRNKKTDPMTPDVYQMCSKRAFEGQVKKWRRQLHAWDPPEDGGEPALLPVHSDVGGLASNPPPPAGEPSDDFEHISHADVASEQCAATPDMGSGSGSRAPKNGGALRVGPAGLPLKIPSAMRKRGFDETMAAAGNNENLHPQRNMQAQPAAPDAKLQRRSLEAEEGPKAGSGAASVPNWTDQRFQDPELDYGASEEEEDGGWQHVPRAAEGRLPGQYKSIYNNIAAEQWDEEEVQI